MIKKVLFSIAPLVYWTLPLLALVLKLIEKGSGLSPANILLNLFFFLIGLKVAILIHELGHLLFAKLVGGKPKRLELGRGHKVFRLKVLGVKILFTSHFDAGFAYAAFDQRNLTRSKLFLYVSGGVLTNFLTSILLILCFEFSFNPVLEIHLPTLLIVSNLVIAGIALIPRHIDHHGIRIKSDGLYLLRIPNYKSAKLAELIHMNILLDALDSMEEGNHIKAISLFEDYEAKTHRSKRSNLSVGTAHLKNGSYEKSLGYFEELLPVINEAEFKKHRNYIYNALAWNYLLLEKLEKADKYSQLAYQVDPNLDYIAGTRGAVLIMNGRWSEGISLLVDNMDFKYSNSLTLTSAMFIGLAYFEMEKRGEGEKYIAFVDTNQQALAKDERSLFNKIKEKIAFKKQAMGH